MWFFVDHPCLMHALSNSLQEIPHAITSTRCHFHVFKTIVWVFLLKIVWFRRIFGTVQKMNIFVKNFFSKCDQIRWKLQICSHWLKKSLMENFIFSVVWAMTRSEWEMHVAAKALTNSKHLKGVRTFPLLLNKKRLTYKISK